MPVPAASWLLKLADVSMSTMPAGTEVAPAGAGADDGGVVGTVDGVGDGTGTGLGATGAGATAPLTGAGWSWARWLPTKPPARLRTTTIGHSLTLALAGLGYVSAPARLVESAIALSILVSGIHAIRPLTPRGEPWIAASFGLMHGLAFATLLGDLGLTRGSLLTNLLGFNLGIELTQLTVVALLMPALLVLSRTPLYRATRAAGAMFGIVLAVAWLAERTALIGHDPLAWVSDGLVAHPGRVAAALGSFAVAAWFGSTRSTSGADGGAPWSPRPVRNSQD